MIVAVGRRPAAKSKKCNPNRGFEDATNPNFCAAKTLEEEARKTERTSAQDDHTLLHALHVLVKRTKQHIWIKYNH
jgi:hypothetical protein